MIVSLILAVVISLQLLSTATTEQATSCPQNFRTPSSDYDEVVNICNVDPSNNNKIVLTSNFLPSLNPGQRVLLVSPFYGCKNYPAQGFECQAIISTADVSTQTRITQTLVFSSLYRASYCNGKSDQLILQGVVGGEGDRGTLRICGKRSNLGVDSMTPFSFITFKTRAGTQEEGFELLLEGPQPCTTSEQVDTFFTPPSLYSAVINLCAVNRAPQYFLTSGTSALFVSQDYGCHTYPHLTERERCNIMLVHEEPEKRLVYTISFMDLRQGPSTCNIFSDRLIFTNVEGGNPGTNFNIVLCGTKKDVKIRARAGVSQLIFAAGTPRRPESRGRGFEVLVQAE